MRDKTKSGIVATDKVVNDEDRLIEVFQEIIGLVKELKTKDEKIRVLKSVATFYELDIFKSSSEY